MSAFALPPASAASSFTTARIAPSIAPARALRRAAAPAPARRAATIRMADEPSSSFNEPQAGDPGYKAPKPVEKGTGMTVSEPRPSEKKRLAEQAKAKTAADEAAAKDAAKPEETKSTFKSVTQRVAASIQGVTGKKLPVDEGEKSRGINLLKEDLFKNAPTRAGVGRQDVGAIMKPLAGEPGYKPAAYETVNVSELGISPFPDDANAVGKVGGINAVKKAAVDVKAGKKKAEDIKAEVMKVVNVQKEPEVFDIPDYLKPIPEDSTRKGYTWKNYVGR